MNELQSSEQQGSFQESHVGRCERGKEYKRCICRAVLVERNEEKLQMINTRLMICNENGMLLRREDRGPYIVYVGPAPTPRERRSYSSQS